MPTFTSVDLQDSSHWGIVFAWELYSPGNYIPIDTSVSGELVSLGNYIIRRARGNIRGGTGSGELVSPGNYIRRARGNIFAWGIDGEYISRE